MYKKSIVINVPHGIHIRIAAMVVHKVSELKSKYNINLYISNESIRDPLAISMLALVSLKIQQGETIQVSCIEDTIEGQKAVTELCDYIINELSNDTSSISKFDNIIEETHIANEQIMQNIPVGILVIDANSYITTMNDYALKIVNKNLKDVVGKYVKDIIPTSDLPSIISSKKRVNGSIQHINENAVIVNRAPIISNNKVIGAIGAFQDIEYFINKLAQYEEQINYYKDELRRHTELNSSFYNIIGNNSSLKDILVIADKASNSTSTVLIRGESGTGKELIAKAIHNNSNRKDMPFVRVNCASIPENLVESELFGYEKGAFTGAVKNKPGKFNLADGGTIFLDEIGDMPKQMQVKLLRVLQEREFESVGGLITQTVDVRVLAATNRNLEEMIQSGDFREDLYYRLNVIAINLPPLRNRKEDINLLVEHFIDKINKKLGKQITNIDSECISLLQDYHWPGNIRELENIIERAINICDGSIITAKDLPLYISNIKKQNTNLINLRNGELLPLQEYEKELISLAMKKHKSFNKAGKVLGITHRTVSLKCKKYGIEVEKL